MQRFSNKVVFITGAASGIGRATAIRLASEGASLSLCDIDDKGLATTQKACEEQGAKTTIYQCDISNYDECAKAIEACVTQYGQLDVLCNIAGIAQLQHFTDITLAEWNKMLGVNLSSVFYLCQLAMPHLIKTKGNILNMASSAGLVGQAYMSSYCATKAAVVNLSKSLAIEYSRHSVRVNALCPGNVKTPLASKLNIPADVDKHLMRLMFPLLEGAQASEIAAAVAYLGSDEARFITGAALPIDGAQTAG
ncbi:MAG: SDR family NAD(P)-dependent oxidoreductase [Glaciecola sp.]|nr:SDR family NAD(P)-dependent oxidoreductase [Glaciecola sp.]MDG1468152.1 SDR family NAD(P)-dependent oxidoreductase [Glaciecola sp.]MDG1921906.1 SDR family NAD(P)-dependent oxidoreductase [Glaciecola sp.]